MVAGGFQGLAAFEEPGSEFARAFYRSTIYRLRDTGEFRVRSIEQNDAPVGEDAGVEAGESCSQRLSGAIGIAQELCGFGLAQQSGGLVDYRNEFLTEMHRSDGRSGNVVAGSGEKLEGPIGRGNRNVIDLCKIVIVGGEPKHG